jgi:predicted nucleic acid-binding protein
MPKPRVYVETTIPNFYYETRMQPQLVARRDLTRIWWSDAADRYELVTGSTVLRELAAGSRHHMVRLRMDLMRGMPVLFARSRIREIARVYVEHKLMPSKPTIADAIHLALASDDHCDFIVTWDCRHLANPNKTAHIRRVNSGLGLHVPELVTPDDLLRRRG